MKFNNKNVVISPRAEIGSNVMIGDNTVIYDGVKIGDNSVIGNDCIIGEPSAGYYRDIHNYTNPETVIGSDSMIRSHCIIYAGSNFGSKLTTGHRVTIREGCQVGSNCLISTLVDIQGNCTIGDYSRLYSNVHVSERSRIGRFVFIYPYSIFTNDPQPPSTTEIGASVGDFSIVTVHCCLLPGVKIGEHCLIGANSVVSRDVENYSFAVGSPAKKRCDVRDIDSKYKDGEAAYPWANHFKRGMPWNESGFEAWQAQNPLNNDLE